MITDLYVRGATIVHRAHPGLKILLLFAISTLVFIVDTWPVLALATVLVAGGYLLAGLKPAHAWRALKPVLAIFAILLIAQLYLADIRLASYVVLRFAVLILAATLLTLTTKVSELVDGLMAGLSRAPGWVPREKIALAIAMTIRFIPRIRAQFHDVRDAQRARGLDRSIVALLVPLVVRTLKDADDIARAIEARSVD
ncbi:energy-coupling factor transporter transmembrane protein EcfT [Pseudohoeflea suaedae]|uniref:Energy-coupling factor transporter transmembrane protein EcfT n=1 Tax=Pseudohoeflea suaedae TaxID=877384 RepID=A0A4R5PQV3_9HYPH|nr:energy-coupling factor transporter transmembrane protein EcfT [Pseudohoeflea suaedae]TDH39293.1 energy-coupling factor transporter transmembrane protein EcfT [Pseudohoeflea suaedae]